MGLGPRTCVRPGVLPPVERSTSRSLLARVIETVGRPIRRVEDTDSTSGSRVPGVFSSLNDMKRLWALYIRL